jgi:hypothetical protein
LLRFSPYTDQYDRNTITGITAKHGRKRPYFPRIRSYATVYGVRNIRPGQPTQQQQQPQQLQLNLPPTANTNDFYSFLSSQSQINREIARAVSAIVTSTIAINSSLSSIDRKVDTLVTAVNDLTTNVNIITENLSSSIKQLSTLVGNVCRKIDGLIDADERNKERFVSITDVI